MLELREQGRNLFTSFCQSIAKEGNLAAEAGLGCTPAKGVDARAIPNRNQRRSVCMVGLGDECLLFVLSCVDKRELCLSVGSVSRRWRSLSKTTIVSVQRNWCQGANCRPVVLPISREATLRELFNELAQATNHPALGLSLLYRQAGGDVVVPHPPPQPTGYGFEDEYDTETEFLIPEGPLPEVLWSVLMQQASCLALPLPPVIKQNVASFLLCMGWVGR
jgi:hypothetical protein